MSPLSSVVCHVVLFVHALFCRAYARPHGKEACMRVFLRVIIGYAAAIFHACTRAGNIEGAPANAA